MRIETLFLAVVTAVGLGSPVDVSYDLLDAIEAGDGYALENLLSEDLYTTVTVFLDQVRELVSTDQSLAEDLLSTRYNGCINPGDVLSMNNEEILGKIMGQVVLLPDNEIEQETATLQGRNANVVITYFNGASVSFTLVWENGGWRVSDTSLMASMFR